MKKSTLFLALMLGIYAAVHAQVYVDAAASGANNGTSWANAYTNLNTAITNTSSGQIWVRTGSYFPGVSGSRSSTFLMKDNVEIYGGFAGSETALNQRDPAVNLTILSGDLDQSGTFTSSDAYHVVSAGNVSSTALVDGFVITGGYANGSGVNGVGAGVYCAPPGPTGGYAPKIVNCDISGNKTNGDGAGMFIICQGFSGGSSGPSVFNCRIHDNTTLSTGGGVYITASGSTNFAIPTFENCLIFNNSAASTGHNIAAVANSSGEVHPQVIGSTIFGNPAGTEMYYQTNGNNCTFDIRNSILYDQDLSSDATFQVENSCVTGGPLVTGSNNAYFDPLFVNPAGSDFHLSCQSPSINNGDNSWINVMTDNGGNPRIVGATVDQGAFESNYILPTVVANATATTLCSGDALTLTGSGAQSYTWAPAASDGIPFSAFSTTTYTVTGTDINGCQGTDQVTITVNNLPNVTGNATQYYICDGASTTLTGSGADTYVWTGGATDGVPFSPTITDTYTVTGTDLNGCQNTSTLTITVYPLPAVGANVSGIATICYGSSVTLYGTGATTYTWDNSVSDNVAFNPSMSALYTVTGTDGNGCSNTAGIYITVEDNTGVSAGADATACTTAFSQNLGGVSGGGAVNWTTSGTGSFTDNTNASTTYIFSGADVSGGSVQLTMNVTYLVCPATSDNMVITFLAPPNAFAGVDIDVCDVNATGISLSGSANNYSFVEWTNLGAGSLTSPFGISTTYNPSPAEIAAGSSHIAFTAFSSDPACPDYTDSLLILIHPSPVISPITDYMYCETDSIYLNASISSGTPPFIYNWQNGSLVTISTANNEYYTPTATDTYTLTVSDTYGCSASDDFTVTIDPSNTISGIVNVGAGVLTAGDVYLIHFIPQQMVFDTLISYPLTVTGTYSFPSVPYGSYLIKVVPDTIAFPNLLPTYYGDTFQWDSATVVAHNCSTDFTADVNMIALLGGTGSGSISGFILEDVGFGTRFGHGHDHIMVPGGPLKGIDVKLGKNPAGGIQARTTSDTSGHYGFYNLPDDSYRIYVDIPGLPMDSFYVVTLNTTQDTAVNLNYYADSNSVYPILPTAVGLPAHKHTSAMLDVFPNPAKNYTSIRFESESQNTAVIRVLDVTGNAVLTTQLRNLPKGRHEYQLNFEDLQLQSGIYFIEVQSGEGKKLSKLVIE